MAIDSQAWGQSTFLGNPAMTYGTPYRQGNTARVRKFLLDKVPYPAGGWKLTFPDTCLQCVYDACLLLTKDPMNCDIAPPAAIPVITVDATGVATMKLYNNGAEVAVGWTGPAGSYAWIRFTGVD